MLALFIILTTLILIAPPMVAMVFQGTLGGFATYSPAAGQSGPQGQPPGSYTPAAPEKSGGQVSDASAGRAHVPQVSTTPSNQGVTPGTYGAAKN